MIENLIIHHCLFTDVAVYARNTFTDALATSMMQAGSVSIIPYTILASCYSPNSQISFHIMNWNILVASVTAASL
jgi:hypothetical protein